MKSDETPAPRSLSDEDYRTLAGFRRQLRRYLAAVTENARQAGLTHHQHQALLAIRGEYPERREVTVGELAGNLLIKHHSAVELVARLEQAGLVRRDRDPENRRRALVSITPGGEDVLERLAEASFRELRAFSGVMGDLVRRLTEFESSNEPSAEGS
ncbi:MarR family winged helix-turn-helix transcriptional regulator [Phenylobacterium sp.]|uniref:MarR family winged helix-turn-helix transcriptional regulator n=1 Tax=Phenylobacterium sp. TaxID=1871053 RepID=UPI002F92E8C0